MKFFITGGTGIVGSSLIKELTKQGHEVIGLKRESSSIPKAILNANVQWINGDLLDSFSYQDFLDSDTIVIHAAAIVSFNPKEESTMLKININGTKTIIDEALAKNIKSFIHLSSVAAIGRVKGIDILNESNKWVESPDNSSYSNSKYYSELEVWRGFEEGLKGFILNPSIVLGTVIGTEVVVSFSQKCQREVYSTHQVKSTLST